MADPNYRARAERVLAALEQPVEPAVFADADLPRLVDEGLLAARVPMGMLEEVRDPALMFGVYRFDNRFEDRFAAMGACGEKIGRGTARRLLGYDAFHWADYNLATDPHGHDKVCRPCWRIHLENGCVHRCAYCGFGGLLISQLNVEEYCEHLGRLIERHPWQETYLLDDDADPPCLEPERGTLGPLIEFLGTRPGRYLIVHTKTWNTEWLADMQHNGHTIFVWSLSGAAQSRLLEPKTGTTEERIEAARVAQAAGYVIRYKFKPIIPVRTWREDAAEAVRLLFERTRPDVISLCVFMWHDVDEMIERLGTEHLDPVYLQAALDACDQVKDTRAKPFPHWVRQEIYEHYLREIRKHDADIPVSISTENFAMWKAVGPALGFTATNYVCGCGPNSTPGRRILDCHAFKIAQRNDAGLACTFSH